ncbi:MAG TPA: hypothetical protein PLY34_05305 [Ferruginibacter sp.]|nr:hypothetical protein [Ferruginibacter sp.]HPH91007.1 hypothetical protein [Ferruginibacter sp.]
MRKTMYLVVMAIAFMTTTASAQKSRSYSSTSYKTALGVKFYPGAISLKHFVNDQAALEGLGYFWDRGFRITGLYEIHGNINGAPGLKWYIGPGAHVGFYNNKWGGGSSFGVDGVLGLDYKINVAPINLSLDWQPSFEFGDGRGFTGNWGGFAIRYTF